MIAVFLHIFYPHLYEEIRDKLKTIQVPFNLYVNLVSGYTDTLQESISRDFPEAVIRVSPSGGMDIGGQLRTLDYWIKNGLNEEYLVFIHSKGKPPDFTDTVKIAETSKLRSHLMSIIDQGKLPLALQLFNDPSVGMIGVKDWHRYPGLDHGDPIDFCDYYCEILGLNNFSTNKFGFIGGTMFWVRSKIFKDVFSKIDILKLIEPLPFQSTGGHIHALERIFGYIVLSEGYQIKGI